MRRSRLTFTTAGALALLTLVFGPLPNVSAELSATGPAVAESCPSVPASQDPRDPVYYDFVLTYRSCLSSQWNWNRTFADVTVSALVDGRVPVSVTTSTALAGAIASVKVGDKEYIGSGGHGSALQYAFHAWQAGGEASECYNPTQAGSRLDDKDHPPPYHGPSTSALYQMSRSGATVTTGSRLANYIERDDPEPGWADCRSVDYQPNRVPYSLGLSPYWLKTTVRMAPDHGLAGLDNVIELSATLDSEDVWHANFSAVLVAYMQRDFTATYLHDPVSGRLTVFAGNKASLEAPVRCTADGAYCLGIYRPSGGVLLHDEPRAGAVQGLLW
ncbi:hypothetical protein K1W54_06775 [Micromonospora sp. CPCC 205371]|nr:hypothetical protein [Micromonospora sp. CPCC 205371]